MNKLLFFYNILVVTVQPSLPAVAVLPGASVSRTFPVPVSGISISKCAGFF